MNYSKTHCSHYVLGECAVENGTAGGNCVGTDKCIKLLESELKTLAASYDCLFNTYINLSKNINLYYDTMQILESIADSMLEAEQIDQPRDYARNIKLEIQRMKRKILRRSRTNENTTGNVTKQNSQGNGGIHLRNN